jgi:hypothetical protein
MLKTSALLAAAVLLTAAAPAALQPAFTGTIVSTYPDGRTAELWMNPSGSFTSEGRRHDRHTGRWTLNGDKVCFHRGLGQFCTPIPSSAEFTTRAFTGETIKVRVVPGRRGEAG